MLPTAWDNNHARFLSPESPRCPDEWGGRPDASHPYPSSFQPERLACPRANPARSTAKFVWIERSLFLLVSSSFEQRSKRGQLRAFVNREGGWRLARVGVRSALVMVNAGLT